MRRDFRVSRESLDDVVGRMQQIGVYLDAHEILGVLETAPRV